MTAALAHDWHAAARCKGMPVELFVPEDYRGASDGARALCATCPVASSASQRASPSVITTSCAVG